ncbi:FAD-dependent monooxygenase [Marinobacter sp. JSM 1782161]|uniref:FAD-dependent monooxygenase n=1 Tax=Marinobacter sp. JSM 1782161 TaxID=2685906 RepID=UPI001402E49B|nr:FAD-dependent monooxygenase [Marinobacter sp. JSM 1782161]
MTQTFDVIIVGAGMVGAALANGLGRAGLTVALLDRQTPPAFHADETPDLRVSALSAGSEAYLERLGAWSRIHAMRLTPYARLSVWDATEHPLSRLLPPGRLRTTFDAAPLGRDHLGHIVENRVTQAALWDQAGSINTISRLTPVEIDSVSESGEGVHLHLADGTQLQGQLLVGADGAQSAIRQMAGIGVTRDQYGQQALVASVRYAGAPQDITWQAFHPSGPRAFLPLHADGDHSWASLVWYDSPARIAELRQLPDDAFLAEVARAFPADLPPLQALAGRGSFPLARQHAKTYASGRTVLVGDAAHTINPLAGQGVNLGFQDAEALQQLLVEARRAGLPLSDTALLQRYEARRRPANQRMMLAMDLFYHAFSNRLPPLHLARNLGLALANSLPFARHQVARYAMGIDDRLPAALQPLIDRVPRPALLR